MPARHYSRPEPGDPSEWYDQREPKILPLLSRLLGGCSHLLFGGDIDKTALVLSPLLASLFMIPLFWYCWRLGVPAAGLMGGLVATFCIEYYQRTERRLGRHRLPEFVFSLDGVMPHSGDARRAAPGNLVVVVRRRRSRRSMYTICGTASRV